MPRYNRNTNPALDVDAVGWTVQNTKAALRRVATTRPDGMVGQIGDARSNGTARARIWTQTVNGGLAAVTPGQTYTMSIYVYQGSGATQNVRVDFDQCNSEGAYVSTNGAGTVVAVPNNTWTRILNTKTVAAGISHVSTFVEFYTTVDNTYVGVACAMMEDGATSPNYRDGNSTGWAWFGSPGITASYEVVIDLRSGQGVARLGLAARASGPKRGGGTGTGRVGLRTSGTGTKAAQGAGDARTGLSGRAAAGVKRGAGTGWTPATIVGSRPTGLKRGIGTGWSPPIGLRGYGTAPPPVPIFTGRPLPEDPLPMSDARYLVQNILTGEWLHTDLPLSDDQVTLTLSGPCEITGKITPEMADLTTTDGKPLLRSWGHVVYLELDGEIRAAGLVTEDSYDDQTQTLVCQGVSAYPSVVNYQDVYTRYNVDPLQVAADMWGYVQSFQNGNLGVSIARTGASPVRLGAEPKSAPAQPRGYLSDGSAPDPAIPRVLRSSVTPAVWDRLLSIGYLGRANDTAEALYVPTEVLDKAKADVAGGKVFTAADTEIEPFRVPWWDAKMCGSVIDEAVKACPADYVEQYAWNFPRTFVDQTVLIAYPRVGRRRDDLRFVQGENIVSEPGLSSDPEGFATAVIGIGAGEGSAALREMAEVIIPGRVRKTYVYRNTKITDRATLRRIVAEELTERSTGGHMIESVIVRASDPNALFGAYNVGDDVLVQVQVPHFGWVQQWSRILSMTLARAADLVELQLRRTDSFRYGREIPSNS